MEAHGVNELNLHRQLVRLGPFVTGILHNQRHFDQDWERTGSHCHAGVKRALVGKSKYGAEVTRKHVLNVTPERGRQQVVVGRITLSFGVDEESQQTLDL